MKQHNNNISIVYQYQYFCNTVPLLLLILFSCNEVQ